MTTQDKIKLLTPLLYLERAAACSPPNENYLDITEEQKTARRNSELLYELLMNYGATGILRLGFPICEVMDNEGDLLECKTKVINIRQAPKGWQDNPDYVYIGRAGKGMDGYFGNPFALKAGEPRGATLERFAAYAEHRMATDAEYAKRVGELRGKTLVCFCKPADCHGDILAELADIVEEFRFTGESYGV